MHRLLIGLLLAATTGCDQISPRVGHAAQTAPGGAGARDASRQEEDASTDGAGMPPAIADALNRFRGGLGAPPTGLGAGASESRDALVERYVRALEDADTAAFGPMQVVPAEFAWLYYPHSRYVRPPHALDADVVWLLIAENARKGMLRALREYGARPLDYSSYRCADEPTDVGPTRLWDGCVLDVWLDGAAVTMRFFGTILEHEGRFKFLSYANDL
jgi:hypothetical protein